MTAVSVAGGRARAGRTGRPPSRLRSSSPTAATAAALLALSASGLAAQAGVTRIMAQDPALDNLVDPPGYETGRLGELGHVHTRGSGDRTMILIPGLGFGADVFGSLVDGLSRDFTTHAVTLPGFGGTAAPPSPASEISFGEQTWTDGALDALIALVDRAATDDVVVVGHWLTGTQLAIRLARARPDRVEAVVLLAGVARFVFTDPNTPAPETLAERVAGVDDFMAPRWFKTVTRETWDDNNFLPGDYAAHPVIGLRLWRQAARPPLHVWVRYLNEFYAQDSLLDVPDVRAPILLLQPGFEGAYRPPGNDYLTAYTRLSWGPASDPPTSMSRRVVPETRIVMWADGLERVEEEMRAFLARARR